MHLTENGIQIIKQIELNHSTLQLRSDGILVMICNDDAVYDAELIKELVIEIGKLTGGKKCKQLTIAGLYSTVTKEGRDYMATNDAVKFTTVEAYVIQSLAQRILGNFYLKFNKPKIPTRMFTDRDKAEQWLKEADFAG